MLDAAGLPVQLDVDIGERTGVGAAKVTRAQFDLAWAEARAVEATSRLNPSRW
ncbi:hypothetical protein [Deinococcus frigens]|uniref:hypothetical protein n=1 Tax=Deinococcus frigens TaxID=249403 RepID=UPI001FE087D9|nr:hypothetical protein [Deinococcus frigens]